jgi:hypothetical protein
MLRFAFGLVLVALGASVARGDVVTSLSGSRLVVTGDGAPDSLAIESAAEGVVLVGHGGTLVDGSADRVTVPGVRHLTVKLKQGDDRLTLTQVSLPDGLDLRLGNNNDDVVLDGVDAGSTRVRTGNGYDAVRIYGPSRLDRLRVQTGNGNDLIVLDGPWVPGDLDVDAGPDEDDVAILATEVGDDLDVHMGNGDDFLELADVGVDDDTHLDGDDGDDLLVLWEFLWFGDDLDIDGFDDGWW